MDSRSSAGSEAVGGWVSAARLDDLVGLLNHRLELARGFMPVEHVDAKGKIGFLESFFEVTEGVGA